MTLSPPLDTDFISLQNILNKFQTSEYREFLIKLLRKSPNISPDSAYTSTLSFVIAYLTSPDNRLRRKARLAIALALLRSDKELGNEIAAEFNRTYQTQSGHLNLSGKHLNDLDTLSLRILLGLIIKMNITSLDISKCNLQYEHIRDEVLEFVYEVIEHHLVRLNIWDNSIGGYNRINWGRICQAIKGSKLTYLDFSTAHLGHRNLDEWRVFAEAIQQAPINTIRLNHTSLECRNNTFWSILFPILANPKIRSVSFNNVLLCLAGPDNRAIFCNTLKTSNWIELDLSQSDFGLMEDEESKKVFEALNFSKVVYLNLYESGGYAVTKEQWQLLYEAIKDNQRILDIKGLPQGQVGLHGILERNRQHLIYSATNSVIANPFNPESGEFYLTTITRFSCYLEENNKNTFGAYHQTLENVKASLQSKLFYHELYGKNSKSTMELEQVVNALTKLIDNHGKLTIHPVVDEPLCFVTELKKTEIKDEERILLIKYALLLEVKRKLDRQPTNFFVASKENNITLVGWNELQINTVWNELAPNISELPVTEKLKTVLLAVYQASLPENELSSESIEEMWSVPQFR